MRTEDGRDQSVHVSVGELMGEAVPSRLEEAVPGGGFCVQQWIGDAVPSGKSGSSA